MTSLIDVIFLLLLFFMLSSTFTRYSELEMSVADGKGGNVSTQQTPDYVLVDVQGVNLNGKAVADADLYASLSQGQPNQNQRVILKTSSEVTSQRLTDVLLQLQKIKNIEVIVTRTQ